MSKVSSENKTCISESILELYRSPQYIFTTSVNCIIPVISVFLAFYAIKKLCSQSIIQYSPRILLISTILFAQCHQVAYFSFKIDVLYQIMFKLNDPCDLQHTSYDCRFITIGTTTGNCGLALSHFAMTVDRMCALLWPEIHLKLKSAPAILFSSIVFSVSFSTWFVLTRDDPLTGWVNHCGFYPTYSVDNFNLLLRVTLYFSILNFIFDIFVLQCNVRREVRWRESYDVITRYESRVALKCTQAMFLISFCQFISNVSYSGLLWLLMVLSAEMSAATYSLCLSIIYATPYACLVLPLLICRVLNYIKAQRSSGISSLRSQKQDMHEHIARMKMAWK